MTKVLPPRPEPSPDTGYDTYLVPRSKTPAKQAIYDRLLDLGWRYDVRSAVWYTPLGRPEQFGRLECLPDHSRAWIQPPSTVRHGMPYRADPILTLDMTEVG